jgi:DNA-binding MarR family transcriptional regulator
MVSMETKTPPGVTASAAPLYAHLGFWLRFVSNHVSGRFATLLQQRDITVTEWVALRALFEHPHTTHAALIQALGMTKGAASKVLSRLDEKGLATRQFAEGNARDQVLSLTKKGRALVPALAALADQNEEHFFGHLTRAQRADLMKAFQQLVAHHGFTQVPVA